MNSLTDSNWEYQHQKWPMIFQAGDFWCWNSAQNSHIGGAQNSHIGGSPENGS